ncbi:MAG: thiamine pyrophosphate-dependent enzyme, partial [bacterium]
AVIGDGTFFHSGLTGLLDAVTSNVNITIVIVDNDITAMTGGQQNPGTGHDLMGNNVPSVKIEDVVTAMGVKHLSIADTYNYDKTVEQLRAAIKYEGPSVVIARKACALFPKKLKIDPYVVKTDICNGCAACFRIGCPAISNSGLTTDKGLTIAKIDAEACTGCTLCDQVCPVDAIVPLGEVKEVPA